MPGTIRLWSCGPGVAVDDPPEAIDRDPGVAGAQAAVDLPQAINRNLCTSRPRRPVPPLPIGTDTYDATVICRASNQVNTQSASGRGS
jgi:hypothetical protein